MVNLINQATFDTLQSYVDAGNFTQFYATLYQNGSNVSGLYIPGPTGQGLFGNYSHAHVSGVIGRELFEAERTEISNTIANGLLDTIRSMGDEVGNFRIPTDAEFLQREIEIFTASEENGGLGYPTDAYPGHDLIERLNLDVEGAVDGNSFLEIIRLATDAMNEELGKYLEDYEGNFITEAAAIAAGAVLDESGEFYWSEDGQILEFRIGAFEYQGEWFSSRDLIDVDGILYVRTDLFSENGSFELLPVGLPFLEVVNSLGKMYENSGGVIDDWTFLSLLEDGDEILRWGQNGQNFAIVRRDTDGDGSGVVGILNGQTGEFQTALDALGDLARDLLPPSWYDALNDFFNPPPIDPLVIDLDGDGVELTALAGSTAFFDLDGDGFAENTGWVNPDDGLLVVDRNGNGQIDDISELFGSQGFTGYEELAEFDTNSDGVVDANDTGFLDLNIWRDLNGDGQTDVGELFTLAEVGITSLSLNATPTSGLISGNQVIETSTVTFANGTVNVSAEILFELSQSNSLFVVPEGFEFDLGVFNYPALRGFGEIPDSWVGMSMDASAVQAAETAIETMRTQGYDAFQIAFEAFLIEWSGAEADGYNGTSPYILYEDHLGWAPKADFLELLMGQSFPSFAVATAASILGPFVEEQFDIVRDYYATRFLAQAAQTIVVNEGLDADLGFLAPFWHLQYNPLEDSIAGRINLFAAEFVEMYRADGLGTDAEALSILALFQNDLPALAPLLLDPSLGLDRTLIETHFGVSAIFEGTGDDDTIVANSDGILSGNAGNDHLTGVADNTYYLGGAGDDVLVGSQFSDHYVYRLGDGNDTIYETDLYANDGTDTLTFADVTSRQVSFAQGANFALVITLPNGETVTIDRHFVENHDHAIETIFFADGVSLNYQEIRDRTVADQVADGATVIGTSRTENYVHNSGDGSYTISETDLYANTGIDTLTFADVTSTDVTFSQGANLSLVITLPDGETVTIDRHFYENFDHAIEAITFADGVSLDYQEIRDRTVADQVADGASVFGTSLSENYVHNFGDGSYTIYETDLYANNGTDTLTFADVASTEVTLVPGPNFSLVITLPNGESVTIDRHFVENLDHSIETITFADGVSLDYQAIRNRMVADQVDAGSIVFGSSLTENYVHHLGDGSYTIYETDLYANTGTDTLTFADVISSDVTFSQGANLSLVITLPNGETVTIDRHFVGNFDHAIEIINFADGVSLDYQAIRDRSVADQVADGGVVVGTELSENYVHHSGDGSYTISETDPWANSGTDTLTFADVSSTEVTFAQDGNFNLLITLPNGEVVTVDRHFVGNQDHAMEVVSFADGVNLDYQAIIEVVANGGSLGTVSFAAQSSGVVVDVANGSAVVNGVTQGISSEFTAVTGSAFDDQIDGGNNDETLTGGAGNDTLSGNAGNDTILGGDGDDVIDGVKQNNILIGEDGNDSINSGQHSSTIDGGSGDDLIVARMIKSVDHMITGGTGADHFQFVYPSSNTQAEACITDFEVGVDCLQIDGVNSLADLTCYQTAEGLRLWFNDDDNILLQGVTIAMLAGTNFLTNGTDMFGAAITDAIVVDGTNSDDVIGALFTDAQGDGVTDDGQDIFGNAGDDLIAAGAGSDVIDGGSGNDTILGSAGHDLINGSDGFDLVDYSASDAGITIRMNQSVFSGGHAAGDNIANVEGFIGSAFDDRIEGANIAESIFGGAGNDTLVGNHGRDTIFGGDGDDFIKGSKSNNMLYGESGNDTIWSGQHSSTIDGGSGDDYIVTRFQKNVDHVLTGGSGADVFEFVYPSNNTQAEATITDFEDGIDLLQISGVTSLADVTLTDTASGLVIGFNDDEQITLTGVTAAMINEDDFVF